MSDDEPYEVAITATAARDLQRLPEKVATACVEFIFGPLVESPHRLGKPLRNDLAGLHSARRGDYRVIYVVDDRNRRIVILHIARRSDVYRL
ncbi:type II toxin-antitoxin system RelE family toxin [Mycobacterium celatum]|uniref:Addiction module toxin RelE n=1 Tax=Mycobacterium celatum TaxID=28045 RepID=A0A1X1RW74_MYCCE|nr:type II toxin-antitoxin system RelE/ParE family toxin [Mycobacterium celatum]ORV18562.1 addiction module toxin RelE [Mycobacterium celatum]PIB80858.1 type II toxin-antitoxin system RelE/ParE family toxin [Mycobacterium celatum]